MHRLSTILNIQSCFCLLLDHLCSLVMAISKKTTKTNMEVFCCIRNGILRFKWTPTWASWKSRKTPYKWPWAMSHMVKADLCPNKWLCWVMLGLYTIHIPCNFERFTLILNALSTTSVLYTTRKNGHWYPKQKWEKSTIWWKHLGEASKAWGPRCPGTSLRNSKPKDCSGKWWPQ
jgi:hypothetical protein